MKKFFYVGIIALGCIIVGLVWLTQKKQSSLSLSSSQPATHTITLGSEGFSPNEITIKRGNTVQFVTTRGKDFWPASDLHPSHDIYPAFDPKQPIEATGSWSFSFEKEGTWRFHDHLAPLFRGSITVE